MTSRAHRILVMAHAHPDFSLGGGELAAYQLFQAYQQHPEVQACWFLGRADRGRGATGQISRRRPNEYLWEQSVHDWHLMKAAHQESLSTWFSDLIRQLRPTVIHTHHYAHLGLEYLRVIKQIDPSIRIVMTLHEYMAICRHNGQMVKTQGNKLCSRESLDDCHRCFPDKTPEDFWLRKQYFLRHFEVVDQFIAPSEFLRQRYIDWGVAPERIHVIENGQESLPALPPRLMPQSTGSPESSTPQHTRNRFAFFGQINPFKGVDLLLEALHAMSDEEQARLEVEIHGANLEWQSPAFQEKIQALRGPLEAAGVLRWIGPYEPHELRQRMAAVDWVVVPSIWWENSPMVIQEALVHGRPLLVSDIGGMREKVRPGLTGLHVTARSVSAWKQALLTCAGMAPDTWLQYHQHITQQRPADHAAVACRHVERLAMLPRPPMSSPLSPPAPALHTVEA